MNLHSSFVPSALSGASAIPGTGRPEFGQASASAMSLRWTALNDAAVAVAMLAGIAPEPPGAAVRNFPAVMRDAGGWRRDRADQGIADLSAVMEPGIAALLAVQARGIHPATAALALWQEFQAARAALLALAPLPDSPAPRRPA